MKPLLNFDDPIVCYLLHRPGCDREAIEARLFSDETFADTIEEAERDLLDLYVHSQLLPEMRALVESEILSTETQRDKLEVARWLKQSQPRRRFAAGTVLGVFAAIAAALILFVGPFIRNHKPTAAREIQSAETSKPEGRVVAFLLVPGVLRGSEVATLHLRGDADIVRLELADIQPGPSASVEIRDQQGAVVWQQPNLTIGANGATIDVSRQLFHSGLFRIVVNREPPVVYDFKIEP